MKATPSNHERVRSLLPSFVHGSPTATGDERAEQHLEEWQGLHEDIVPDDRNATDRGRNGAALEILSHTVEQDDPEKSEPTKSAAEPVKPATTSRLWSSALTKLSIAAVFLLAIGTVAWYFKPELISVPAKEILIEVPGSGSSHLLVVFEKSVEFDEQEAFVREIGARVVRGPSAGGAYLIELGEYQNGADTGDALLERLENDPRIRTISRANTLP